MNDKIQLGKYQCEHGLDDSANQQSINEEISGRIITNPIKVIEVLVGGLRQNQVIDRKLFDWFMSEINNTKARDKSAQAEIEEWKDEFKRVDSEKDDLLIELSNRDSSIKELEQSTIDAAEAYQSALDKIHKKLECCGNCGNYKQRPSGYNLREYCAIIEDETEKFNIAKYDNNCVNWIAKNE
jgi:chromosome segregation ATPase